MKSITVIDVPYGGSLSKDFYQYAMATGNIGEYITYKEDTDICSEYNIQSLPAAIVDNTVLYGDQMNLIIRKRLQVQNVEDYIRKGIL